ncbi:MAG: L-aspartate oxidase [Dehalococcoides mccartyi]|uniref:L-aspartate oxidase n=1 Tax=Dehalococcoides mccartyi TaxID=61435 RepID=UPI0004E0626B|nr:L-aspartate oxidase [Dehalococcoides mccartyi]AII59925.1 aspartate oxidase [Dehalococcoides mccartyi CG4]
MISRYDYIIIGSGIAGLYTALLARGRGSVLLVTKGKIQDCNTRHAQGGIAAAIGPDDSPRLHFEDTLSAGDGLCDPEMVRLLSEEAPQRIAELVYLGVPFDSVNGEIALTLEAAHSRPRILHAGGDATGKHIEITLNNWVRTTEIEVLEDTLAKELIVENGRIKGVATLDTNTGAIQNFECRFVILATGGAGQLFSFTTNPEVATADGVALAFRAGAEIKDMEFYQFHPTAIHLPGVAPFLISEAVRGEGGILRNTSGKRFMPEYAPQAELAPRDVVARSIHLEMLKTQSDHVYLDVTHLPPHKVSSRFPQIYRFCLDHGLDIAREAIPVSPAAHYMIGGVKVNSWGETNIKGLFACGEVACTGVHGANRLASNSLLEVLVFGRRIIEYSAGENQPEMLAPLPQLTKRLLGWGKYVRDLPDPSIPSLQKLLWEDSGIIRSYSGLSKAQEILSGWQYSLGDVSDRKGIELANLILAGRLMVESALLRQESRGAHYRTDFPGHRPEWEKHIVFIKED